MRDRTADLLDANQTLSQLSYGPSIENPKDFHTSQTLNLALSLHYRQKAGVLYALTAIRQGI